jgi:hypothetical protein
MGTRAMSAGMTLAEAIIEMVNLMYNDNTAQRFYQGLLTSLQTELDDNRDITVVWKQKEA